MPILDINKVGSVGVVRDVPPHRMPPEVWSNARNVRFSEGDAVKFLGHARVLDPPSVSPEFLIEVPAPGTSYVIYVSLTRAFVVESGTHTEITRASGNYTATSGWQWNGTLLGGIAILNNSVDVPQYWPSISAATKLADLTNWPSSLRARVLRAFGPYLVALNVTKSGAPKPHMVKWSHPADPGTVPSSWDETDATKDAGEVDLSDVAGGVIVDGLPLGNSFVVYKEAAMHLMRFVGGQFVFAFSQLADTVGALATGCVAAVKRGGLHFVAAADDIVVHNGQRGSVQSIVDGRLRSYLQSAINYDASDAAFCFDNSREREAWFCFPSSGSTVPNQALVWNYRDNSLALRDFEGNYATSGRVSTTTPETWDSASGAWDTDLVPWAEIGGRKVLIADSSAGRIYELDSGGSFDGQAVSAYVERTGLALIGRDQNGGPIVDYKRRKLLKRVWPKIEGSATVNIRVGTQEKVDGSVVWEAAKSFTPGVDEYVDFSANGRLLAIRFESSGSESWRLEGYSVEIEPLGQH